MPDGACTCFQVQAFSSNPYIPFYGFLAPCAQTFNQLLLRPECCAASNVRFVAEGLRKLDAWIMGNEEYLAALYSDLRHIRQVRVSPHQTCGGDCGAHTAGAHTVSDIRGLTVQHMRQVCIWCQTYGG